MHATFRRPHILSAFALFAALAVFSFSAANGQEIDPFSEQFKRDQAPKLPDANDLVRGKGDTPQSKSLKELMSLVELTASVSPAQARRGEIVTLRIAGKTKNDAHVYSAAKRHATQIGRPTEIVIAPAAGIKPLSPITEENLHRVVHDDTVSYELEKDFAWTQQVLVTEDAPQGQIEIKVQVKLMACTSKSCTPFLDYPTMTATLNIADGTAVSRNSIPAERFAAPKIVVDDDKTGMKAATETSPKIDPKTTVDNRFDLGGLLWAAFIGAFLMLLTPCVFPMIPITVNFFIKQSEKEHHKPFAMAGVYAGTIVLMLTIVMLALGNFVIYMANNEWFNLALGGVLILFALSLFGMYEIELPHFLSRFTSQREGQGGMLGTIFMALTFTITSFTCTGPFLGIMLAPVAGLQPPKINLILAALVYSATFAAPFFLLALFPSMLKKLPKSGGWMNVVKVTMGFLELGAALKFLANFDLGLHPGNPRFFNYDTVLCAWIALSLASAFYLFGMFRLPHDDAADHIGVFRMVMGTIFFGLAFYMTPLLVGITPKGIVMEAIVAFLPPTFEEEKGFRGSGGGDDSGHLTWHKDYLDGWKEAKETGKLMFLDFTGVNCTNCRDNEKNVFPKKEVIAALKKYVRVQLYTDTVPNPKLSSAEAGQQAQRNIAWQEQIADLALPSYVIWSPDRNEAIVDGKLKGTVVAKRNGKIFDVADFIQFLQDPVKNQPGPIAKAETKVAWHYDYETAWKQAKAEGKKLFIDFTGQYCINCRKNETTVLSKAQTQLSLNNFVCVHLYADSVPNLPPAKSKADADRNFNWQVAMTNEVTRPLYVVFDPGTDAFENGVPAGKILARHPGLIYDANAFRELLAKSK
jgi:thiol:disulfide interchange protein